MPRRRNPRPFTGGEDVKFSSLLTSINVYDGDLFRNIKTARESIDCYDDLGNDAFDTAVAVDAEMRGHVDSHAPIITRPFDYGTVISYSFDAAHWQDSRFSDGMRFGVWYGSEDLETTIFETVHRWRRFVLDSFSEDKLIVGERRIYRVRCQGLLIDLVDKDAEFPALRDPNDYGFTQQIGAYLVNQGQNGLRVRSARCDGINAAIFRPSVLSNPRDFCYLSYLWNPSKGNTVRVERERGQLWLEIG